MEDRENWKVYLNGEIVPLKEAKVSVFDRGFQYGEGVFEGIRCYNAKIFKLDEHVQRLFDSARAIHIQLPISKQDMKKAIKDTAKANGFKNAHMKPMVTRGVGWKLGFNPNDVDRPTIAIIERPITGPPYWEPMGGIRLAVVSVRKIPACCFDPRIKSLNYLANIMARIEAQASGANEAIMLDIQGYLAEGTGDNIFLFRRDALLTPPTQSALEGITRQTVMMLAKGASIRTHEALLSMYDVYTADEVFVTGTGTGIIPVIEVDKRPIGDGKPGRITQQLIRLYAEEVKKGEPFE